MGSVKMQRRISVSVLPLKKRMPSPFFTCFLICGRES